MFKRKKQLVLQAKPPPLPPPPPSGVRRKSVPKLTVSECLQQAQGALQRLRTINPGDLQAFPLLNEIQRLVQQLKEATASLSPSDREAWSFQISELEEEFQELADMVVSRADAAPKPEPRQASPAASSNSGAVSRSSMTSALISPTHSGRVQQAVALFSRRDGVDASEPQAMGLRRVHPTYQQQQQRQQQQQQQQQQQGYKQQPQQAAYPQAASSAASTPARSDSSFMYLTNEERELLAQKQQALLQKHFTYLAQQREAAEPTQRAAAQDALVVSAQQVGPSGALPQPPAPPQQQQGVLAAQQQHTQASLQAMYHIQRFRPPPQEYSSAQVTSHEGAADTRQSPAWSATGSSSGAQGLVAAGGHPRGEAATPWPGNVAGGGSGGSASVSAHSPRHQGLYSGGQPGLGAAQQQSEAEQEWAVGGGGDVDDLFSGLDIVVTDEEQPPPAQQPQLQEAGMATDQAHTHVLQQQQQQQPYQAVLGTGTSTTGAGVHAAGAAAPGDAHLPQQGLAYNFRPVGHSVLHQMYPGRQVSSWADGAGSLQQALPVAEAPAGLRGIQSVDPTTVTDYEAGGSLLQTSNGAPGPHMAAPQAQEHQRPAEQVREQHYPAQQLAQQLEPPGQKLPQQPQAGLQPQPQQQQYPPVRLQSASAQGYHYTRSAAESGINVAGVLASPSWQGAHVGAAASPFAQAAADGGSELETAASTSAASDAGASVSYPVRKKTAQFKLGYGIEAAASSSSIQGPQQQAALATYVGSPWRAGAVTADAAIAPGSAADWMGGSSAAACEQQRLEQQAAGYSHQGGLPTHQGTTRWVQQQQQAVLLQRTPSRPDAGLQPRQQQIQQQQVSRPATPGYAQQSASAATCDRDMAVAERPSRAQQYGTQYAQQQEQQQQYHLPTLQQHYLAQQQQQYVHHHHHEQQQSLPQQQQQPYISQQQQQHQYQLFLQQQQHMHQQHVQQQPPPSPQQQALGTDAVTYPVVKAQRGEVPQLPPHHHQQQQQQKPNSAYPVLDTGLGHYPQAWPDESMHAQHKQGLLQPEMRPAPQLQQHTDQQHLQGQMPLCPSRPGAQAQSLAQAGGGAPAALLAQAYMPATPEEQARTQLLQQISGILPPAMAATGGAGQHALSPTEPTVTAVVAEVPSQGTTQQQQQRAIANTITTQSATSPSAVASATAAAGTVPQAGAQGPDHQGQEDGSSSTIMGPASATVAPVRPSPYISAFLQHAQSALDRGGFMVAASLANPRSPVIAMAPALSPEAAEATATGGGQGLAAAPLHARAVATGTAMLPLLQGQYSNSSSVAAARSPAPAAATMTSALSLPLSISALRSRSRGLVSGGGGGGGVGGGAPSNGGALVGPTDPSASLPALASLPNLIDLEAFLNNITGPVDACRAAAEQRAREMVSALATALSQAQKVEASVQQQRRAVKAALAGVIASVTQLESDQEAAVEGEDFDTAAALDEQLTQLTYRRANMDEQARLLAEALQGAAALRLQVLGRQEEVWRTTGAYLAQLQTGQQQMAATLASQADRESQAAAMLHRAAQEALAQRRAALEERTAELDAASAEVAAQVAAATAPAEAERQRRASARDVLKADVESLRALLAAKEAELVAAEAAVADAAGAVRQQTAAYDHEMARLEGARRQLEGEAEQVAVHAQALQDSERQAEARAAAVEEHQSQLRLQAESLGAAAEAMRSAAEVLARRVEAEARSQEQRARLLQADEKAREDLKGLERCISDLSSDLSRLAEQRGRLATERAATQEGLASLQRALPELEMAKRAAAANKDFREAARLSGELRVLSAQADVAAAQLARVSGAISELAAAESGKVSELEELRAMVHEAQRHAAEAHHRYLVFSLGLSRAALDEAVVSELYEEAGALQVEVAAEEAEALALERTWGFARPQLPQPPQAAAARRRTVTETSLAVLSATAASAVAHPHQQQHAHAQLQAQLSSQSLGGLSAQSSRSLPSQLPAAAAAAAASGLWPGPGPAGTSGLKGTPTSPTGASASAWQQHHPPRLLQPQQQSNPYPPHVQQLLQHRQAPQQHCSWHKRGATDADDVGDGTSGSGLVAATAASPPLQFPYAQGSPHAYVPPPPLLPPSQLAAAPPQGPSGPPVKPLYRAELAGDPRVVTTGAGPVYDSVLPEPAPSSYGTPSRTSLEIDRAGAFPRGLPSPLRPVYVPPGHVIAVQPPSEPTAGDDQGLHSGLSADSTIRALAAVAPSPGIPSPGPLAVSSHQPEGMAAVDSGGCGGSGGVYEASCGPDIATQSRHVSSAGAAAPAVAAAAAPGPADPHVLEGDVGLEECSPEVAEGTAGDDLGTRGLDTEGPAAGAAPPELPPYNGEQSCDGTLDEGRRGDDRAGNGSERGSGSGWGSGVQQGNPPRRAEPSLKQQEDRAPQRRRGASTSGGLGSAAATAAGGAAAAVAAAAAAAEVGGSESSAAPV